MSRQKAHYQRKKLVDGLVFIDILLTIWYYIYIRKEVKGMGKIKKLDKVVRDLIELALDIGTLLWLINNLILPMLN